MIAVANRLPQPEQETAVSRQLPFISIICPVRNEEKNLGNVLLQLLAQDYDPARFEILVVDGASTDGTRDLVRAFSGGSSHLRLLSNPKRWSCAARNVGIRAARGSLILIIDGHCDLRNDRYLSQLAEAFEDPGVSCIGRPQPLEVGDASPLQRAISAARSSPLGHHPDSFIFSSESLDVPAHSVAVAYRRDVFDKVGMFDETFDACEDVELNHRIDRAGLRCRLEPELRVFYHPRASLKGLFFQLMRYGRGRVRLLRKHPETFSPLGFAPALLVSSLICGAALAPWHLVLALMFGLMLALYALPVIGMSAALAVKHREASFAVSVPAVFAALHFGAGCGVLLETARGMFGKKSQGWQPGQLDLVDRC